MAELDHFKDFHDSGGGHLGKWRTLPVLRFLDSACFI
jgi:hypothetical protein